MKKESRFTGTFSFCHPSTVAQDDKKKKLKRSQDDKKKKLKRSQDDKKKKLKRSQDDKKEKAEIVLRMIKKDESPFRMK